MNPTGFLSQVPTLPKILQRWEADIVWDEASEHIMVWLYRTWPAKA